MGVLGPRRARSPLPVAGLRKVMLRAHRQAWCWQDEWMDLTMEDIRQLEEETARMLAQKMAKCGEAEEPPAAGPSPEGRPEPGAAGGQEGAEAPGTSDTSPDDTFAKQWSTSSRSSYSSQHGGEGTGPVVGVSRTPDSELLLLLTHRGTLFLVSPVCRSSRDLWGRSGGSLPWGL